MQNMIFTRFFLNINYFKRNLNHPFILKAIFTLNAQSNEVKIYKKNDLIIFFYILKIDPFCQSLLNYLFKCLSIN